MTEDELFWGYPRFLKSIKHLKYFRIPKLFRETYFKDIKEFLIEILAMVLTIMNLEIGSYTNKSF